MATVVDNHEVIETYTGTDASANTDDRIMFISDGSAGLTANHPYFRYTSGDTPIDMTLGGSSGYTYSTVTVTGTLSATAQYVACNQVAAITLTLPQISTFTDSKHIYYIKDISGNASTNNITIDTTGGDTIDGGATAVITLDYQAITFVADGGTNWSIF
ncbi:hypothetical protein KDA11_01990 [Candidatus Saccharibacteria bacterium]|nr:hypothetical protein [Candidatus Saccharibacteria bacterium]